MFIILNWYKENGSDVDLIVEILGGIRIFFTREEAEEYCNTELNGFYKVVDLEE